MDSERKEFDAWFDAREGKPHPWVGAREEKFQAWQARAELGEGTPHCTEKLNNLHMNHIALQAECEALRLKAARYDLENRSSVEAFQRCAQVCKETSRLWNEDMQRLEAECGALKKANALLQQHHATAWNRGHEAGMRANRQTASDALKAVESDAWGNTQLTEALLASEAECEALRKDAARYDWLRSHPEAVCVTVSIHGDRIPAILHQYAAHTPERLDAAIDAAMAAMGKEKA